MGKPLLLFVWQWLGNTFIPSVNGFARLFPALVGTLVFHNFWLAGGKTTASSSPFGLICTGKCGEELHFSWLVPGRQLFSFGFLLVLCKQFLGWCFSTPALKYFKEALWKE